MKRFLLLAVLLLTACSKSFITDPALRKNIAQRIEQRKAWLPVIPVDATAEETELLEFLLAYSPVADIADNSIDLFHRNIRSSLLAKKEFNWDISEQLFLHFVLPIRVNNENLDTSREDFYIELKGHIKGLSMKEAILEVNHWCHEKVTYTPSDRRTSSPSATIQNAQGRCGEESTFTVAALRAVGIPARQVYTPRWAHSDSNHAWVEAWADGEWHYMGACEPEAILNTGWFDQPATRAMLMHTKVFGDYAGNEEIIDKNECFTEINVTSKYANVAPLEVEVVATDGSPIEGAVVDFGIYNYSEFYPAVRKKTDTNGKASLTAGLGTMVIWANNGKDYGFSRVDFGKDKQVRIALDNKSGDFEIDIIPPAEKPVTKQISAELRAANTKRLNAEDSIRSAYVSTFMTVEQAKNFAFKTGSDPARTSRYLTESRGNHTEICKFLADTPKEQLGTALDLLEVISDKDLHDTPASVLRDHLSNAFQYSKEPYFKDYILNPRIKYELLSPYRSQLSLVKDCHTPEDIIATAKTIKVAPELNPTGLSITPLGIHNLRIGDQPSIDTYIIALFRSKGIAARHEPLTENLQYFDKKTNKWINITSRTNSPKGSLNLIYGGSDNPKYGTHFTLAKLIDGTFTTIDMKIAGNDTYSSLFAKPVTLDEGTYRLTSGTRLASGAVMAAMEIFSIEAGKESVVQLSLRQDSSQIMVIGSIDPESPFVTYGAAASGSILSATGRGYFIIAILAPKQEPTNHALRDLASLRESFENWGRSIILLFKDENELAKFDPSEFDPLPGNVIVGHDFENKTFEMIIGMMKVKTPNNLPIFVVADTFGRVVFFSQGYHIGLGEQIIRTIEKL